MSIPAGLSGNLPVGLQLIGNYFEEGRLLNIAHQFQLNSDWHLKIPEGIS
jgi:aspartyl-tRNA(Asn)/glutamyl-tRNA(Gln) amidotransferase subunit A